MRRAFGLLLDFMIAPAILACALAGTAGLLRTTLPAWAIPIAVLAPAVAAVVLLERLRPERPEYRPLDQPLRNEVGHFLLGLEAGAAIGNGAAILAGVGFARLLHLRPEDGLWPTGWPFGLQLLLAALLGEAVSYWQHRLIHHVGRLWPFHALHHSGERLNFARAGRFHAVDIATGTFFTYVPMTLLGAPEPLFVTYTVLSAALGLVLHANIRMRTPAWLDVVICTPAVHRFHHSRELRESDGNFGTTLMIFDLIFGTYIRPRAEGPARMGIESDPVPQGFWRQVFAPFRTPS